MKEPTANFPLNQGFRYRSFLTSLGKTCEVRGERLEAEREMKNVKVQMPNDKKQWVGCIGLIGFIGCRGKTKCEGAVAHIPGANIKEFLANHSQWKERATNPSFELGWQVFGTKDRRSKILFSERNGFWATDRKALSEGKRVFSEGEHFSAARSDFSGGLGSHHYKESCW